MSNPSVVLLQVSAAVANGICLAQTPGAAGNLTINGSLATAGVATLTSTNCAARRVAVVSSNAGDTTQTVTITGTNQSGAPISNAVTLNGTTSVQTALDFATITQVATSAATTGALTVGTNTVASSPWIMDDFTHPGWRLRAAVSIASGSVNYTVEHTYCDPNKTGTSLVASPFQFSLEAACYVPPLPWPDLILTNQTVNGETNFNDGPIMAHRLTINSGTGLAVMQSIQSGIGGF